MPTARSSWQYKVKPSPGSKAGAKCRESSGNLEADQEEKTINKGIEDGETRTMAFQVEDITKP